VLLAVSSAESQPPKYDPTGAVAWLTAQGCTNASVPLCPGSVPCHDAEFVARALAAGGVVNCDPNAVSNDCFTAYVAYGTSDVYDLTETVYFVSYLQQYLQWVSPATCSANNPDACYPVGAVPMSVNQWGEEMPIMAVGHVLCTSHSPTTNNGPHCSIPCQEYVPSAVYYPPVGRVVGPLFGTFTPNNQTFQDLNIWVNTWNLAADAINQAVSVINVGWAANDAAAVEAQLDLVWSTEVAVPIINWMPYPYKTWTRPSPNTDITSGLYDDYIDQFLAMLSRWLSGSDRIFGTMDDRRAYLRFAHEPNGDWFPWSPQCPSCGSSGQRINQTTESYVAMWRHVIGKKVRGGNSSLPATVLQVMFGANNDDAYGQGYTMEQLFPGAPVDWVGVSGNNWGNTLPLNQWITPSQIFSNMVQRLVNVTSANGTQKMKPMALSTATTSHPNGAWAKFWWVPQLFDYTKSLSDVVKMVWYHNCDSSTDLAVFGGEGGLTVWTSPLSEMQYNVYQSFADCINNGTVYGLQGANASDPGILSTQQFWGLF
jgi:mannan endo-1,4-beta-mannosidase